MHPSFDLKSLAAKALAGFALSAALLMALGLLITPGLSMAGALAQDASGTQDANGTGASALIQTPCEDVIGYEHERVACGYLAVRETPQGRNLSLAVAVVKARDTAKALEPVIFLHGGPGGQIVKLADHFSTHPINATRDFILFDQRGAGVSKPQDCPQASPAFVQMLAADLSPEEATKAQTGIERACHDLMTNDGADFNGYGTSETVGDMEVLRKALNIESWNLFGVSYGTTVALDYVRKHPERTRALILDSVYPPSAPGGGDTATRNFARALEQLYADCRMDDACRRNFPGLETSFLATLIALERSPLAIPAADKSLFPTGVFYLNSQDFASIIHQMLYRRDLIGLVPKTIDLAAQGKANALAGLVNVLGPLATRINLHGLLSVECRERTLAKGRKIDDFSRLERFLRRHLTIFDTQDVVCADWSSEFSNADFNEPVSSPVPAIFYAGANDPITPPDNTLGSFRRFPNGQYIYAHHTGHGVDRTYECVRGITVEFLDNPKELVRDACVADISPIAFVGDVALSRGVMPFATGILRMRQPFMLVTLGIGTLTIVIGLLWTLTTLSRGHLGRRPSVLAVSASALGGTSGLVLLSFAIVVTLAIADVAAGLTPTMLVVGLPVQSGWVLLLPAIALGLFVLGAFALVAAAARGGANTRPHTPLTVLATGCAIVLGGLWWQGFFAPVA